MNPHPIEAESFRILGQLVDLKRFSDEEGEVVARVIHSTAEIGYQSSMSFSPDFISRATSLMHSGAPVFTDVNMTAAGISGISARSALSFEYAMVPSQTRSYSSMWSVARANPVALYVVGCSPTSLDALLDLEQFLDESAVIGLPVGFVGATESKARLSLSRLAHCTCSGVAGGSAAAAGATNALLRILSGARYVEGGRVQQFHNRQGVIDL